MAQITELLERYADFRELVRVTDSLPDPDPAVSMLRQGFSECYDALKVTWIPCEERTPDTDRYVWAAPVFEGYCPVAYYLADQWWIDDRPLSGSGVTHWGEIRLPEPPQKEGVDVGCV